MINNITSTCKKCSGKCCADKISIFSTLKPEQLDELSKSILTQDYRKGNIIFSEGDSSNKLYIIGSGSVKTYKYTKEGKAQIFCVLSKGDFIGDLSLLKTERHEYTAEALEDSTICFLSKEAFDMLLLKNPEISIVILEKLHDKLVGLENLIQTLSTKDMESRIATFLVNLARKFHYESSSETIIDLPLNREDIGNYIGVTRETVSRTLSSMQDQGLIELKGTKRIILKDIEKLKEV